MRILLVHPGPEYATHDVWAGLRAGLLSEGHDVVDFMLANYVRIEADALRTAWREAGMGEPSREDRLYHAGHPVYAMILRYGVDAVVVVTGEHWHPDHTLLLRRAGMAVGIVHTEAPYRDEPLAPMLGMADIVWVNERTSVRHLGDAFRLMGLDTTVRYLPLAYNERKHGDGPAGRYHDVVFVGSGFKERVDLLQAVDWSGVDLGLYGDWSLLTSKWPRRLLFEMAHSPTVPVSVALMRLLPRGNPLWRYVRSGIITNDRAAELYRGAAIGLNLFRSSAMYNRDSLAVGGSESMGPRLYELAACGAFVMSEHRAEVHDVFGDLVPTFSTPEELEGLVRFWLPRVEERREVALQLREAVRPHSYRERARQLVRDLNDTRSKHSGRT